MQRVKTLGMLALLLALVGAPLLRLPFPAQAADPPGYDILLIIDESGSMWEQNDTMPAANDPKQIQDEVRNNACAPRDRRSAGVRFIADLLNVDAGNNRFRLAVLLFNSGIYDVTTGFQAVSTDAERRDIIEKYERRRCEVYDRMYRAPDGGAGQRWTDARAALSRAREYFFGPNARPTPGYLPAVVILSDGLPETATENESTAAASARLPGYLQAIRDQANALKQQNVAFNFVVLSENAINRTYPGSTQTYKNFWQELASGNLPGGRRHCYEQAVTAEEINRTFRGLIWKCVRGLQPGPGSDLSNPPTVTAPTDMSFEITSNHASVTVSVDLTQRLLAATDTPVTLYDPSGAVIVPATRDNVRYAASDYSILYNVEKPQSGMWTVRLTRPGKVRVDTLPISQRYAFDFLPAHGQEVACGKPVTVQVGVRSLVDGRAQGQVVPSTISAEVAPQGGTPQPVQLRRLDDGRWQGQFTPVTTAPHAVSFQGTLEDGTKEKLATTASVTVIQPPWLRLDHPVEQARLRDAEPVEAAVTVMRCDKPETDAVTLANRAKVQGKLFTKGSTVPSPVVFQYDSSRGPGGFTWSQRLPAGEYTLETEMVFNAGAQEITDTAKVSFQVQAVSPPPAPVVTPDPPVIIEDTDSGFPWWLLLVAVGLVATGAGIVAARRIVPASFSSMELRWVSDASGRRSLGELVPLRGRSHTLEFFDAAEEGSRAGRPRARIQLWPERQGDGVIAKFKVLQATGPVSVGGLPYDEGTEGEVRDRERIEAGRSSVVFHNHAEAPDRTA